MKDVVISTQYINTDGSIGELNNKEQNFNYRYSIFKDNNYIVISTRLSLKTGDKVEIKKQMEELLQKRKEAQPIEFPNAGSTFKRGTDFITAKLIDEAGLKGYKIGGAMVSTKHAGFIVNLGDASSKDILDLIKYVKDKIFEKYEVKIEEEIEIIGED
jgi:UDP-N-acetylmuramate dehydrogenase